MLRQCSVLSTGTRLLICRKVLHSPAPSILLYSQGALSAPLFLTNPPLGMRHLTVGEGWSEWQDLLSFCLSSVLLGKYRERQSMGGGGLQPSRTQRLDCLHSPLFLLRVPAFWGWLSYPHPLIGYVLASHMSGWYTNRVMWKEGASVKKMAW